MKVKEMSSERKGKRAALIRFFRRTTFFALHRRAERTLRNVPGQARRVLLDVGVDESPTIQ